MDAPDFGIAGEAVPAFLRHKLFSEVRISRVVAKDDSDGYASFAKKKNIECSANPLEEPYYRATISGHNVTDATYTVKYLDPDKIPSDQQYDHLREEDVHEPPPKLYAYAITLLLSIADFSTDLFYSSFAVFASPLLRKISIAVLFMPLVLFVALDWEAFVKMRLWLIYRDFAVSTFQFATNFIIDSPKTLYSFTSLSERKSTALDVIPNFIWRILNWVDFIFSRIFWWTNDAISFVFFSESFPCVNVAEWNSIREQYALRTGELTEIFNDDDRSRDSKKIKVRWDVRLPSFFTLFIGNLKTVDIIHDSNDLRHHDRSIENSISETYFNVGVLVSRRKLEKPDSILLPRSMLSNLRLDPLVWCVLIYDHVDALLKHIIITYVHDDGCDHRILFRLTSFIGSMVVASFAVIAMMLFLMQFSIYCLLLWVFYAVIALLLYPLATAISFLSLGGFLIVMVFCLNLKLFAFPFIGPYLFQEKKKTLRCFVVEYDYKDSIDISLQPVHTILYKLPDDMMTDLIPQDHIVQIVKVK